MKYLDENIEYLPEDRPVLAKSKTANSSILLKTDKSTNFIYKIEGSNLVDTDIIETNSINTGSKIKERIEKIRNHSGILAFSNTENSIFGSNLTVIDSALPNILSEMLLLFFTSKLSKTVDLVNEISKKNPIGYNIETAHPFYTYKIKRFLTDITLGMMPSRVWTGQLDATGGHLVVKEGGEVLCYHIYNRNEFEDYLLSNTKFETASSTRHDFGVIYKEEDQLYFKLNLQIRFLK